MSLLRSLLSSSHFTLLSLKTVNLPEIFGLFVYSRFSSNMHLDPWLTVPSSLLTHEDSYVLKVNPESSLWGPVAAWGCRWWGLPSWAAGQPQPQASGTSWGQAKGPWVWVSCTPGQGSCSFGWGQIGEAYVGAALTGQGSCYSWHHQWDRGCHHPHDCWADSKPWVATQSVLQLQGGVLLALAEVQRVSSRKSLWNRREGTSFLRRDVASILLKLTLLGTASPGLYMSGREVSEHLLGTPPRRMETTSSAVWASPAAWSKNSREGSGNHSLRQHTVAGQEGKRSCIQDHHSFYVPGCPIRLPYFCWVEKKSRRLKNM